MSQKATIIERGRGPQLSTCKLTVQDLLPMFKSAQSDDEILQWYPQIGHDELQVLRQYFLDHRDEVLDDERRIAAEQEQLRQIYRWSPTVKVTSRSERRARMEQRIVARRGAEVNGVDHSAR